MATKIKTMYVCSACGYSSLKPSGRCSNCGEWNTMIEKEVTATSASSPTRATAINAEPLANVILSDNYRYKTHISELDRVLGGGIVKGSMVLLAGDPGIGKSTLLLQMAKNLDSNLKILYVSGEESPSQIKIRASRLKAITDNLFIISNTNARELCNYIDTFKPDIVFVDSIQTMYIDEVQSSRGSIVQVRECTSLLLQTAKSLNIPMIIVGHVNKGGEIAGPKVMEHIVDTVLYFEGDRTQSLRILRATKNRFGSTNEIGVFEMQEKGLEEVQNPSMLLLSGRLPMVSGSTITCTMEGSRPLLAEIQGLVSAAGYANAKRVATGFDHNRLSLLIAVLEKRAGFQFANLDTYINVVSGLSLDEPAVDLAVILSLASGLRDTPVPDNLIAFGEVGLSGEIRAVPHAARRISEAGRLGFSAVMLPKTCEKQLADFDTGGVELIYVRTVRQAIEKIL